MKLSLWGKSQSKQDIGEATITIDFADGSARSLIFTAIKGHISIKEGKTAYKIMLQTEVDHMDINYNSKLKELLRLYE